jgi:hypothetical protein
MRLLEAYASVRAPLAVRAAVGALVVEVLVLDLALRIVLLPLRLLGWPPPALPVRAACPNGHQVELVGWYACPVCAAVSFTHAWNPCGVCGEAAGSTVFCPCGASVGAPEHLREDG